MPVIRSRHMMKTGLVSIENVGDKQIFTHAEEVTPIFESCHQLRKRENKGFSKDRLTQHIARIPELVFYAHPELTDPTGRINKKALRKFLQSPEGMFYRTSEGNI